MKNSVPRRRRGERSCNLAILEQFLTCPACGGAKVDMYYVYILRSEKSGKYYIGYTSNLEERLRYHNSGRTKSLRKHIPLEIVKIEEYAFYEEARKREKQIKKYKSGEAFKRLLESSPPHSAGCKIL